MYIIYLNNVDYVTSNIKTNEGCTITMQFYLIHLFIAFAVCDLKMNRLFSNALTKIIRRGRQIVVELLESE